MDFWPNHKVYMTCQIRVIVNLALPRRHPTSTGFSYSERERNHCEQPFAFPSSMRELVLPHVMHHLIVSVYFRDLRWKLLFALRNRFISVYRTRKQRDLPFIPNEKKKYRNLLGKFTENPNFSKKVNRSAEILEISGENSNGTEVLNM